MFIMISEDCSRSIQRFLIFFLAATYCNKHCARVNASTPTLTGPSDVTVAVGGTAVFNCTVTCSAQGTISWYMNLPASRKSIAMSQYTTISQMKSIYGLEIKRSVASDCPREPKVVQLSLLNVTADLNGMPVQCGALLVQDNCECSGPQLYFSKFGVLTVVSSALY